MGCGKRNKNEDVKEERMMMRKIMEKKEKKSREMRR